jgi:Rrf2 family protein
MLKLTKKTDYAIMAVNFIACQGEGVANTRRISEAYNIPLPLLAKILQKLTRNRIITSQSGPRGGYLLAKPISQITIADILRAIEGPIHIIRCCEGDHSCSQLEHCSVQRPLQKIEDKLVELLEGTTIEQMYSEDFDRLMVV